MYYCLSFVNLLKLISLQKKTLAHNFFEITDAEQIEVASLKREIQTLNQDVKDLYLDVLSVLSIKKVSSNSKQEKLKKETDNPKHKIAVIFALSCKFIASLQKHKKTFRFVLTMVYAQLIK